MKLMKVIESFIEGKINAEKCEDALWISDDFIAVIDGVSSKSNYSLNGWTTGKIAADIIYHVFEYLPAKASVTDFVHEVNRGYEKFYAEHDFDLNRKQYGLQAVAGIYSAYHRQIWLVGDCQAKVDGKTYTNAKRSDDILSAMRSLVSHVDMAMNHQDPADYFEENDLARLQIIPWILKSNIFANDVETPLGYAVINGEEIPIELIKTIDIPKDYQGDIILTTDGYPTVRDTLAEAEKYLVDLLREDPYLISQFCSTKGLARGQKSFDDRTYIRFQIGGDES